MQCHNKFYSINHDIVIDIDYCLSRDSPIDACFPFFSSSFDNTFLHQCACVKSCLPIRPRLLNLNIKIKYGKNFTIRNNIDDSCSGILQDIVDVSN